MSIIPINVAVATRTLLAAGYELSGVQRQPSHIEFKCERVTRLGPTVQLLIALTSEDQFTNDSANDIRYTATNQNRLVVLVSNLGGTDQLSWDQFAEIMGGAVPAWKAVSNDYRGHLESASVNKLPPGMTGEAWWIFESLVADGLEFCFGRSVNRLGGQNRGKRVSDIVAPLPDFSVIVVDAKASAYGFDANAGSLRALAEYVEKQKRRQRGGGDVIAALVVSSKFVQNRESLAVVAQEFFGQTRTPLCFMAAGDLWLMVQALRDKADIRHCIRWNMIFVGGLIIWRQIETELNAVKQERVETREL